MVFGFYKCSFGLGNCFLRSGTWFWIGGEETSNDEGCEAEESEAEEEPRPSSKSQDCSTQGSNQEIIDNITGEQESIDCSTILVSESLKANSFIYFTSRSGRCVTWVVTAGMVEYVPGKVK